MTAIIVFCITVCLLIIGVILINPFMSFKSLAVLCGVSLLLCVLALKCVDMRVVAHCKQLGLPDCTLLGE